MTLKDFWKRRAEYVRRERERQPQRLAEGDDTPFFQRVNEEMLIDVVERLEKLEALLAPAPEEEVESFLGHRS